MFFWDFFGFVLTIFYFAAYIMVVVLLVTDLFRDEKLSGWWKALWILFLLGVPFLTALVYLIVRGGGMAARANAGRQRVQEEDSYRPAPSASPADDIARAKELLDAGHISQGEFEALKSKALGNQYFGA